MISVVDTSTADINSQWSPHIEPTLKGATPNPVTQNGDNHQNSILAKFAQAATDDAHGLTTGAATNCAQGLPPFVSNTLNQTLSADVCDLTGQILPLKSVLCGDIEMQDAENKETEVVCDPRDQTASANRVSAAFSDTQKQPVNIFAQCAQTSVQAPLFNTTGTQ